MKKYFLLLSLLFCSSSQFAQCNFCNYIFNQGTGIQGNDFHISNNTLSANCSLQISGYQINWGDGYITTTGGPIGADHTYCYNGTYTITISIWKLGVLSCTQSHVVTVSSINYYSTLNHTLINNNAHFIGSYIAGGGVYPGVNHHWNFGDGVTLDTQNMDTASHIYLSIGTFYPFATTDYFSLSNFNNCNYSSTAYDTVIITCLPYNLSNNQNICVGSNYTFPDNTTYSNILSDTAHTSHFISALGCDSLITTHIHINPTYNQTENKGLCIGDNYTFHDGTVFSNITGNTSHVSYLISMYGCDSNIVTNLSPLTVDKSIDQFNNSFAANEANASYQWLSCNPYTLLIGDTNQNYSATSNGEYAVIISKNGCIDTSSCYPANSVSVNDFIKENQILVYPNPTNSILNIEIQNTNISHSNMEAILCNTLGEVLLKEKIKPNGKAQFSVSHLSSGVYYIRCEGYCRKIIKE